MSADIPEQKKLTSMKQISSPKDFAMNGAEPAFEQPLHVGRPNIGSREAFLKYAGDIFGTYWLNINMQLKSFPMPYRCNQDFYFSRG